MRKCWWSFDDLLWLFKCCQTATNEHDIRTETNMTNEYREKVILSLWVFTNCDKGTRQRNRKEQGQRNIFLGDKRTKYHI